MKTNFTYFLLLFSAICFLNFACSKSDSENSDCIKVKIISNICGQTVFQILDPKQYALGENGWSGHDGTKYDHVFFSILSCNDMQKLSQNSITQNTTILIKKEENQGDMNCAVCLALLLNPPKTQHFISICK